MSCDATVTGVPSSEIVMFRCTVIAILAGAGLRKMGHPLLGTPKVRLLVMARAVIGYFALSTYFYRSFSPLLSFVHSFIYSFSTPIKNYFPMLYEKRSFKLNGTFHPELVPSDLPLVFWHTISTISFHL